ncbi:COP9 signalosome complex subunit 8 [Mortierella sp. AD094]|nr:COP9 signalosome complex subunit 8 [Mortierella sp. AD094]
MTAQAQQIIEQADSCLKAGRYEELIILYEQLEFQVSAIEIDAVPLNTIYEPLLASYLVAYDLHSARSLVGRIPEEYKTQAPHLATLIQVLEMMRQWERQNGNLKDIYNLLHQSRWDTSLAPLVALLQDSIQERELNILAKAYTSLPVQLAASRVWVGEDAAAEQPTPNRTIGLQEFGQLADVVAHLEVKQESS